MLLTLTTTHRPATDLGYLLHKHPARLQSVSLPFGEAHVFYPECDEERCTAALHLDVDAVGLMRGRSRREQQSFALGQYVNDRPYVASSFASVALAKAFGSALNGRCKDRPTLVDTPLPLELGVSAVPTGGGGPEVLERFFAPLGYEVASEAIPLDEHFPAWGASDYRTLVLRGTVRLADALAHLYVLLPALDADRHYYIGEAEVAKLLARGRGWLDDHPHREEITRRYLLGFRSLTDDAAERFAERSDGAPPAPDAPPRHDLHGERLDRVRDLLLASGATSVIDLGCGTGKLLRRLLAEGQFARIAGCDVDARELARAREALHVDDFGPRQAERLALFQAALTYRDARLAGFDAAALVEVIEHLDPPRLAALERVVFREARPRTIVLSTPNAEWNQVFGDRGAAMRHADHRFEWTRAEFRTWAEGVAERRGYAVRYDEVGFPHPDYGCATQIGIFTLGTAA